MSLINELIYISDGAALPSPYSLTIEEFKNLNTKELAFVYFMVDHKSPFSVYEWEQRIIEVKNSIFDDKSKWTPSSKVLGACGKPIFHAKDLIANLSNMGKVVDGLSRLEEIVKKEEQAANTNRGGIEVNKYSM